MSHRPGHGAAIVAPRKNGKDGPPPSTVAEEPGPGASVAGPGEAGDGGGLGRPKITININVNVPITTGKNPNAQAVGEYIRKIADAAREAGLL